MMQHVYIIGSKGIPARYGGYETFVENLTAGKQNNNIYYHVASRSDNSQYGHQPVFYYNNSEIFNITVPNIGPAQAIVYDLKALSYALQDAKNNNYQKPIFYILTCRIGPFMKHYIKKIHQIGGFYFVNPDGHEWKRAKWSWPVRKYWKYSEKLMVKYADLVICDNRKIEEYIKHDYAKYHPETTFIAYGTAIGSSKLTPKSAIVKKWYAAQDVKLHNYYLIVGRFVPENNYEIMLQEFMLSKTKKDLVIITNVKRNKFYHKLLQATNFTSDARIKFVGTIYDQELLKFVRENAYGYIHGHEVGGTNPSLLEALSSTQLNLLIDVGFNHDVAHDVALYWTKKSHSLANTIDKADQYSQKQLNQKCRQAQNIVKKEYTWPLIIAKYETKFGLYK